MRDSNSSKWVTGRQKYRWKHWSFRRNYLTVAINIILMDSEAQNLCINMQQFTVEKSRFSPPLNLDCIASQRITVVWKASVNMPPLAMVPVLKGYFPYYT